MIGKIWNVFLIVVFCLLVVSVVSAQDGSGTPTPVDPYAATVALVIVFCGGLERFTNGAKPFIRKIADRYQLGDDTYNAAVIVFSVGAGIVGVLVSNQQLNIFSPLPFVPPLVGTVFTGAICAFGAGVLHAFVDGINSYTDSKRAVTLTLIATRPSIPAPSETK